jgi:tetratricopeptide (TPR) repeat protein
MNAYGEAVKAYSRYKDIDCSLLLANIANVYSNCQMYSVAEKYYLEAINERKSKSPKRKEMLDQMYRQLSLVREKMEKYSEALDSLEKAGELAQQGYGNTI